MVRERVSTYAVLAAASIREAVLKLLSQGASRHDEACYTWNVNNSQWTFMAFLLLFEIGSAISGAATSSTMLIVGRAIAGMGAAGLMSGTLSILAVAVSVRLRAAYTGVIMSMFGLAVVVGPLVGGAFTQHVSCRPIHRYIIRTFRLVLTRTREVGVLH